jgi:hypothetical protein
VLTPAVSAVLSGVHSVSDAFTAIPEPDDESEQADRAKAATAATARAVAGRDVANTDTSSVGRGRRSVPNDVGKAYLTNQVRQFPV